MKWLGILILTLLLSSAARATDCTSVYIDETGTIPDAQSIEKVARQIGSEGVEVRVRVLKDPRNDAELDNYVKGLCKAWRTSDGNHWVPSFLLLAFAPNVADANNDVGLYFGHANASRLAENNWRGILEANFGHRPGTPAVDYKNDHVKASAALFNTLQTLRAVFAVPAPIRTTGNITVNQVDYSQVGWIFLYFVIGCLVLYLIVLVVQTFLRRGARRGEIQSAQNAAQHTRSLCISGINEITDTTTLDVLEAKIAAMVDPTANKALATKLAMVKSYGTQALSAFDSFDSLTGDDPNKEQLVPEDYRLNQNRYADIITRYITNARTLIADIQAGNVEEHKPTRVEGNEHLWSSGTRKRRRHDYERSTPYTGGRTETPYYPGERSEPPPSPPPAAPAASTTTIIRESGGGFGDAFSGAVLGNVLGRVLEEPRQAPTYSPPPSYVPPTYSPPANEDSGGSIWSGGSSSSSNDATDDTDSGGSVDTVATDDTDEGGSIDTSDNS